MDKKIFKLVVIPIPYATIFVDLSRHLLMNFQWSGKKGPGSFYNDHWGKCANFPFSAAIAFAGANTLPLSMLKDAQGFIDSSNRRKVVTLIVKRQYLWREFEKNLTMNVSEAGVMWWDFCLVSSCSTKGCGRNVQLHHYNILQMFRDLGVLG